MFLQGGKFAYYRSYDSNGDTIVIRTTAAVYSNINLFRIQYKSSRISLTVIITACTGIIIFEIAKKEKLESWKKKTNVNFCNLVRFYTLIDLSQHYTMIKLRSQAKVILITRCIQLCRSASAN